MDRVHACGRSSVFHDFAIITSTKDQVYACGRSSGFYDFTASFLKPFGIMATTRSSGDVGGMDGTPAA